MTSTFDSVPPTIQRYSIPSTVIQATADALRRLGQGCSEAVALWQGRVLSDTDAEVTKLIIPKQITGPRHFNVPLEERLRIIDQISNVGEFILVQIHTHPRQAFHSEADDLYAITKHLHAISIVVPYFAVSWSGSLSETSIHLNLGAGNWRQLSDAEVSDAFQVV